jgi:DNA polymerase elongation subunit (family B)
MSSKFYTNAFLHRNQIYYTGYENGERFARKVKYEPYLFVTSNKETGWKTLDGQHVAQKYFGSSSKARAYMRENEDVSNFEIYGNHHFLYTWINDTFPTIEYDSSLINVVFLDIEVESDRGVPDYRDPVQPINAITISKNKKYITFGCGDYTPKQKNHVYVKCKDEKDLLLKFLLVWNKPQYAPDVLTGWNVEGFDIPYLYCRIKHELGEKNANRLSPWGIVETREVQFRFSNKTQTLFELKGISTLDYMLMYRKFSFKNQEQYSLNYISFVELGEKKIDYSEYESLLQLYKNDYEKFIDYNLHDVVLVERLNDKLNILEQVYEMTYYAKCNFMDTLGTVRMWDTMIHNHLLKQFIVVPMDKKYSEKEEFEKIPGAFVKDPVIGMYDWVVSFDLTSQYPSLIQQYNIGSETFVKKMPGKWLTDGGEIDTEWLKRNDLCCTANLCLYKRSPQSFFSELMEEVFDKRTAHKKQLKKVQKQYEATKDESLVPLVSQYHYRQMAMKILMNSGYGALLNKYFRFFNRDNGEAITSSGQMTVRYVEKKLNEKFRKIFKTNRDYVIYIDTDSVYIAFDDIVKNKWKNKSKDEIIDLIDKLCEIQIQPFTDKCFAEIAARTNAVSNKMAMKRESIAEKGLWTTKKRYALKVWDSEGVRYHEPEYVIKGFESVRSTTPSACRVAIKELLCMVMNEDEKTVQDYVEIFKNSFADLPLSEIAKSSSVSGMKEYADAAHIYSKGTPIHTKGALLYNNLLREKQLDKMYPYIYNGDKIKYVYLKEPNPIHEHVISFHTAIPKKLGIEKYIDYDRQYRMGFLKPIESILSSIGWKVEEENTLEELL